MSAEDKSRSISRRDFLRFGGALGFSGLAAACNFPRPRFGFKEEPNPQVIEPEVPTTVTAETLDSTDTPDIPDTPKPTETPEPLTYFEKYVYPALKQVAKNRRESKAREDSDFWHRVDSELNRERVNFALLGIGSEKVLTDSIQIMSLDLDENEIRIVSIQRDIWVPEVSMYNNTSKTYRINQVHWEGGMDLTETVLENATGLSADFVVVMDMDVLPRAVKDIFNNRLEVCIPWEVDDANMGYFPAGLQTLTGEEILRVSRARYYASNAYRNTIQQYVLRGMLRRTRQELGAGTSDAAEFLAKGFYFFGKETLSGRIKTNFDPTFFLDMGGNLASQLVSGGVEGEVSGFGLPVFTARYGLSTESAGDPNDKYRKKPVGGYAYGHDLVSEYWFSSREETKDFLTGDDLSGFEAEMEVCGLED